MDINIKEKIEELVERITADKDLTAQFQRNPVKAVEGLIGRDLPDDVVEKLVAGVKGKISLDKASGAVDMLKKLF